MAQREAVPFAVAFDRTRALSQFVARVAAASPEVIAEIEARDARPYSREEMRALLAPGEGLAGRLMHELIEKVFLPAFGSPLLSPRHDAAVFAVSQQRIAFTTDSYVVRPLFFPGGDIGSLAVNGTVNDLAMAGARPLYLSVAFIIEEGLSMETLRRVVGSM